MSGELEPNDSRNVTGTASTPDGHWTGVGQQPPLANGETPQPTGPREDETRDRWETDDRPRAEGGGGMSGGGISEDDAADMSEDTDGGSAGTVQFTPDDELNRKVGADGGAGGLSNEGAGEDMENRNAGSGMGGSESGSNQSGAGGNTFTGGSGGQAGNSQAGFGQQNSGTEASQQQQFDQSGRQMADNGMNSSQMGGQNAGSLGEQIREHMSVVDAEGTQVGTVDAFENDQIKLTRSGSSDGQHHYLPIDRVAGIEGDTISLHDSGDSVFGSNGS